MTEAINTLFTLLVVAIFFLFFVRLIENVNATGGAVPHNHGHHNHGHPHHPHRGHWYY